MRSNCRRTSSVARKTPAMMNSATPAKPADTRYGICLAVRLSPETPNQPTNSAMAPAAARTQPTNGRAVAQAQPKTCLRSPMAGIGGADGSCCSAVIHPSPPAPELSMGGPANHDGHAPAQEQHDGPDRECGVEVGEVRPEPVQDAADEPDPGTDLRRLHRRNARRSQHRVVRERHRGRA